MSKSNRLEAARYGLTVADIQTAVSSGIGGKNIAENIEGRERYPHQRPLSSGISATTSMRCEAF